MAQSVNAGFLSTDIAPITTFDLLSECLYVDGEIVATLGESWQGPKLDGTNIANKTTSTDQIHNIFLYLTSDTGKNGFS